MRTKGKRGVRSFYQTFLNFKHLGWFFSPFQVLWVKQFLRFNRKQCLIIVFTAGRPQVILNIPRAASSMCEKRSCCLCQEAQNGVWFSFWLLHFPFTTNLIWCALSLLDLITSFLELPCCSNWLIGKNAKWVSNSFPSNSFLNLFWLSEWLNENLVLYLCYLLRVPWAFLLLLFLVVVCPCFQKQSLYIDLNQGLHWSEQRLGGISGKQSQTRLPTHESSEHCLLWL